MSVIVTFVLIVAVLPTLIGFGMILAWRRISRFLTRRTELLAMRNPWTNGGRPNTKPSRKYFLVSSLLSLGIACDIAWRAEHLPRILAWAYAIDGPTERSSVLGMFMQLIIVPIPWVIVMFFHYSGVVSRANKYEVVIFAALTSMLVAYASAFAINIGTEQMREFVSKLTLLLIIVIACIFFMLTQYIVAMVFGRVVGGLGFRRWYYHFQSRLWWLSALVAIPLLLLYLLLRYHSIEVAIRRPILYFRSFRFQGGPAVFSRVVTPAARRFGVVAGLVTEAQLSSDLQASLEVTDQARFAVATTADWQYWVKEKLRVASVAIVDVSGAAASVMWELHASVSILGPERVLVLYSGPRPNLPMGTNCIEVTPDRKGIKKARREATMWFRSRLLAS